MCVLRKEILNAWKEYKRAKKDGKSLLFEILQQVNKLPVVYNFASNRALSSFHGFP